MSWVIAIALIGGCLATPLQQGNLKIVNYRANRDGFFPQNDGIPIAPQPIVYNPQQPYFIQEPTPLTYSQIGGSVLTERDQQRHLNIDEEIEAREEGADEEPKPVEEPKVESNVDSKDESVVNVDDQKPVQSETAALIGSSVLGVKGGPQPVNIDGDNYFSQVVSGQRRLVESQPQLSQLYGVKGKLVPSVLNLQSQVIPQQRVIYHNLQNVQQRPIVQQVQQQPYHIQQQQQQQVQYHFQQQPIQVQQQQVPYHIQQQVPIQVDEQRISGHGVQIRKPIVQYQQLNPVQRPFVPREWIRKPIQSGVKGVQHIQQQPIQYFIQPIIPSDINVVSGGQQEQPQVLTIQSNLQGVKTQQRGQEEIRERVDVPKRQDDSQVVISQQELSQPAVQDVQQQRPDALAQKQGVKSPVDQSVHKVVVQTSQHQVPIGGQQQLIGYQLVGQQPQQILYQQPIQPSNQQNVQYVPVSDIQRYYQLIQSQIPIQSVGQQDNRYISYAIQNQQGIDQPIQYSGGQVLSQSGQPIQSDQVFQSVNPFDQTQGVGGLQGSQRIQGVGVQQIGVQEDRQQGVKGQDLRVNPSSADQRRQRSFIGQRGVKGAVNV